MLFWLVSHLCILHSSSCISFTCCAHCTLSSLSCNCHCLYICFRLRKWFVDISYKRGSSSLLIFWCFIHFLMNCLAKSMSQAHFAIKLKLKCIRFSLGPRPLHWIAVSSSQYSCLFEYQGGHLYLYGIGPNTIHQPLVFFDQSIAYPKFFLSGVTCLNRQLFNFLQCDPPPHLTCQ